MGTLRDNLEAAVVAAVAVVDGTVDTLSTLGDTRHETLLSDIADMRQATAETAASKKRHLSIMPGPIPTTITYVLLFISPTSVLSCYNGATPLHVLHTTLEDLG